MVETRVVDDFEDICVGEVFTLSERLQEEINEKRLFEGKGPFSGTNECECGGEVNYSVKRSDGAEIGVCATCKRQYIDPKGKRLPSVYDRGLRV